MQRIDPELTPEKVLRSLVYAFEHGPLKIQTVRPILDLFVLQALETRNPTATLEDAVAYLKKLIHDLEYYTETQEIIKEANRETAPGQITNPENPDNCSENPNNFSDCHNCRYFVLNESKCLIHYDTALEAKQISAGLAGECRDWKPFERTAEEKNEHEPKSTLATIAVFPDCHTCRYYLPWSQVSKCLIDKDTECGKTGNCPKWKIQIENQKLDRPPELFSSRL